ncbi:MAG: hypothetical protein DRI34_12725, partial [Deltaproteobacteria bacterium]
GRLEQVDCRARGLLCEQGACVEPWRYGSPQWSECPDDPLATPESLHDKMVYYEDIVRRLHLHPRMRWVLPVLLACDGSDCSRPAVGEEQATWQDVERWLSGENDGLWSALYLAAEAYRYAVTGEAEVLDTIGLLLEGERQRLAITGVPGVFTRQLIPPGVEGLSCPDDLQAYVPDVEKDDNQWVRVSDAGCVEVVDASSGQWRATEHCGLDEFAGWCWLDNVSQDEYAGHMFGLAAVYRLVDDEQVQQTVRGMLSDIGTMLVDTRLQIVDWDGRPVEHGRLYALAMDNFPGFNAAMALAFVKVCAAASGDPAIEDFYENCLLQRGGEVDCLHWPSEQPRPYTDYLGQAGLYVGQDSCLSNWNNISMHFASLHDLLLVEFDPQVRAAVQRHLQVEAFAPPDTPRPVAEQNNAWFDIIYAAWKALGPGSDGPAYGAVENAVCMLRQFPSSQAVPDLQCPPDKCQEVCTDRLGHPLGSYPRQVAERCPSTFLWWGNPYSLGSCNSNSRHIKPPTDYLLAYWMARYFGFIDEDQ